MTYEEIEEHLDKFKELFDDHNQETRCNCPKCQNYRRKEIALLFLQLEKEEDAEHEKA